MARRSPRCPGLAHGWEGPAWTALQQIAAGLAPWDAPFARGLARRLRAAAETDDGGPPSPFIGLGGAAIVAAHASALEPALRPLAKRVIARFTASRCTPAQDDVFLGHPGAILALAEIREHRPDLALPRRFVARCHRRTLAALRRMLAAERPHFLGLAHGLAGLLLAAECAAARLGQPRDRELIARAFDRLAASRTIAPGLGAIWTPTTAGELAQATSSWCHGAAGIALALHGCHLLSGARAYRELFAEAAGPIVRVRSSGQTFCCGRSGRAQVLVELYRQTGDRRWLAAARRVAAEPARRLLSREYPAGFHQGALGPAYLAARLEAPDRLALPATGCARPRLPRLDERRALRA